MTDSRVECYSGHAYAGDPRALTWEGNRLQVAAVERRWRTPDGPAFEVRTGDGRRFDLRYVDAEDRWWVRELPA